MDGQTIGLVVTGLVVGAISGMLGIGGAIMLIPALMVFFAFPQARAQGTSLGALVPPIGIFAAMQYYRNGLLDVRAAALIALGFAFGALGGATLVPYIPQTWLKRAFATLLVYVAAQIVFVGPNRRMGAVLPGLIAIAALWGTYYLKRALGRKPPKPPPPTPPTPPEANEEPPTEYYI